MVLIFISAMGAYSWYSGEKAKQELPAKQEKKRLEDDKNNQKATETLWFNRFGAVSRPNRSIENMMTLLASEKTLDAVFEYIAYQGTVSAYEDFRKGLDGIATEEDRKMLDYYKESLKHKSHH